MNRHDEKYWDEETIPQEIVANLSSIDILNKKEHKEFEEIFSSLFIAYKEVIK